MPKLELSVGWHLETGSTRAIKPIKAKLNLKGGGKIHRSDVHIRKGKDTRHPSECGKARKSSPTRNGICQDLELVLLTTN